MSEKLDFKQKLERLDEILNLINNKETTIDESLKLYEEGKNIVKTLEDSLKEAEEKIEQVIETK